MLYTAQSLYIFEFRNSQKHLAAKNIPHQRKLSSVAVQQLLHLKNPQKNEVQQILAPCTMISYCSFFFFEPK